jgi:predicted MFS family arabinose efflux permease
VPETGVSALMRETLSVTPALTGPGERRWKPITLLALVVGLQAADLGTVGALVVPLTRDLHISNLQVGLLVTVSTGVGALATLLAGPVADRANRVRLLWVALLFCSAAMALSALSPNYGCLLGCRIVLGAGVAVSGPVVASLMGDYFAPGERGRVYGWVLAGEGACTGLGLLVSGQLAAVNWRLGFWWLALVGLLLSIAVGALLREPLRGATTGAMHRAATPRRSVWRDVRYVLSIRTNLVLVVGCSFGYFFMAGLSTFGVALLREQFRIGQSLASLLIVVLGIGALVGVLSTGRLADWLITRGHIGARTWVGGAAFLAVAMFTLPTLLTHNLPLAILFAFVAAIGLGGVNPPLNAARLDIVHSRLWGTAEAVRTTLTSISTGLAPVVFGLASAPLGLGRTFLIMLSTLVAAAVLILCVARRTYPRDVATAMAADAVTAPVARREPTAQAA